MAKRENQKSSMKESKFLDLNYKMLHIKIGDKDSPASDGDIDDIQKKVDELFTREEIPCLCLVTHHAVEIDYIEPPKVPVKNYYVEGEKIENEREQ